MLLFQAIASRNDGRVGQLLDDSPNLAVQSLEAGASREDPVPYFLVPLHHYAYAGDTALHIAAAAHDRALAESLVGRGAMVRARNRRGAEPLHYAADGGPDADIWNPDAQAELISFLVDAGADPAALDKSGVAPLHRAVRCRCSGGVRGLLQNGADPLQMNKSGSTPLHLAVQNTGKSNSGSDQAKDAQRRIIVMLLEYGARPSDPDTKGKSVADAATSAWIRELLDAY